MERVDDDRVDRDDDDDVDDIDRGDDVDDGRKGAEVRANDALRPTEVGGT